MLEKVSHLEIWYDLEQLIYLILIPFVSVCGAHYQRRYHSSVFTKEIGWRRALWCTSLDNTVPITQQNVGSSGDILMQKDTWIKRKQTSINAYPN